ncbi:MAG: SulP family inorganic anion transporter [Desulfobacterales bacterium]|jgi:SulP family sulfate permease|nr:SulP family inorganic anion transporter [Desulfobacterales bacterium]
MKKPRYTFAQLRGDLFGGLTAGVVALPLALAFGVASGAGAIAGLYGAIAVGFFAAWLGGTRTQVSGPTGPMTVIMAAAVAAFPGELPSVFTVVLIAGLLQIVFGLIKLGGFVRYIPYPVISGFMSGIGVIILLLQLHPLLGGASVGSPLVALIELPKAIAGANPYSLLLAGFTLLIVFKTPLRISRVLPSPLIALFCMSLLSAVLSLPVDTIGKIPAGLPQLSFPSISAEQTPKILAMAIALSVLGVMDSLLTSIVADSMTRERHDSNRELIGQGVGNMVSGLIGGLPGAGATMRTVVNIKAGGSTRLSGMIHSLFLLAVLLGLGKYTAHIPMAVLAGILIKVGVDILDYRMLKVLNRAPREDLIVMLAVFGITVFVDLIAAVTIGVALAALLLTYRMAQQTQINVSEVPPAEWQRRIGKDLQEQSDFRIRVISVRGAFFFGTTTRMQGKINKLIGAEVVIINCLNVPFMDISAAFALSEMVDKLKEAGIRPILVITEGVGLDRLLQGLGCSDIFGKDGIQVDYNKAVELARDRLGADGREPPT